MADYTSNKTGAALDSATDDSEDLVSATGLNKDIRIANTNKLQGLSSGAALIDLAYVNGSDEIVYGEAGSDIVMISDGVLIGPTGTATGTAQVDGDDLVIDGAGNRGLSIISANTAISNVFLGDTDDSNEGNLTYNNSTDILNIGTGATAAVSVNATQDVTIPNGDLTVSGGLFGVGVSESLVISGGIITVTKSFANVETQGGSGTDDVDTINGGSEGDIITLSASSSNDIVFKNGTGNISMAAGDQTLSTAADSITFIFAGTNWLMKGRSA